MKRQLGNIVSGVYRPVLAKRVPVIGSTPEQRRDREQESQRKKTLRRGTRVVDARWVQKPGRNFPNWPSSAGCSGETKRRLRRSRCPSGRQIRLQFIL